MERLVRVMQVLRPGGLSQDAGPCNAFSGQQSSAAEMLVAAATAHRGQPCSRPTERPGLDDIEKLLHDRKRRRQADPINMSGDSPQASREPWTAVGTLIDMNTLKVSCRPEVVTSPTLSAAGCLEALAPLGSDSAGDAVADRASPQRVAAAETFEEEPLAMVAAPREISNEAPDPRPDQQESLGISAFRTYVLFRSALAE